MSDDWDFYMAKVDHQPASIMVDLGIKCEAPKPTHPCMGYLRLYMQHPRDDGLSSNEEFDDLYKIGDAIEVAGDSTKHLYVGRNTSNGVRDFYFYTSDAIKLMSDLAGVMAAFPSYEYETGNREDPLWDAYLNFLYPDAHAAQRIWNRRVCDALGKQGDNLQAPRMIDHWAFFAEGGLMQKFIEFLPQMRFVVKDNQSVGQKSGAISVNFERIDAPEAMDDVVFEIIEKLAEYGGSYDGWGCSVTQSSTTSRL